MESTCTTKTIGKIAWKDYCFGAFKLWGWTVCYKISQNGGKSNSLIRRVDKEDFLKWVGSQVFCLYAYNMFWP